MTRVIFGLYLGLQNHLGIYVDIMCLLMFPAWILCYCHYQLPVTAIREIKILNELSHCSMVKLLEVVTSVGEVSN